MMFWWAAAKDAWQRAWDGLIGWWEFVVIRLVPGWAADLARILDDD